MSPQAAVVVGGGGHARVILDILSTSENIEVIGFTSPESDQRTVDLMGVPRLGADEVLPELLERGIRHAFVAIGDNLRRKSCTESARQLGFSMINAVSSAAVISPRATLGIGVAVMPGAVINAGAAIGDGVIVNTNASIDHDCEIGCFAHIGPGAAVAGSVKVGAGVLLGIGSRVIPGVAIGCGSIVGAGGVVVRDLPPGVVAMGVPAAVTRKVNL